MKRKAMIFAAGLGTRLRPLTDNKPKALIEIGSTPLLGIILKKLTSQGFNDIIINIHHFGEQILDYISKNNFGASISISDERDLLLDTGGGLKKAAWFFSDGQPFLVHNVDVMCDLDLNTLYEHHLKFNPLVTLSVKDRTTSRSFLVNNSNELCGWRSNQTGELRHIRGILKELRPIAFDGVQIISPALFDKITEDGVFSITDLYLRLCKTEKILVLQHDKFWLDMGKKENFEEAEKHIKHL
jgi:NDP-sugar pyrophosphorylase family protein